MAQCCSRCNRGDMVGERADVLVVQSYRLAGAFTVRAIRSYWEDLMSWMSPYVKLVFAYSFPKKNMRLLPIMNQAEKNELLSQTLVSRLPDCRDKLKKQIHKQAEKLTVIESSPESSASRGDLFG